MTKNKNSMSTSEQSSKKMNPYSTSGMSSGTTDTEMGSEFGSAGAGSAGSASATGTQVTKNSKKTQESMNTTTDTNA